ncbi:MAG: hypothetical protein WBB63_15020 [Sphingobacterium thalpophilum]
MQLKWIGLRFGQRTRPGKAAPGAHGAGSGLRGQRDEKGQLIVRQIA